MRVINVAAVALNQTPLDWSGNKANVLAAIEQARSKNASIVCLPELSITGYGCEDAFLSFDVQQRSISVLMELIPETENLVVAVGLPMVYMGALYNCVALIANQELVGFAAKSQLAGDGIHYEPRWFKPWPLGQTGKVEIEGQAYPVGALVFDVGGVKIGFEICEDAWTANRPGTFLAQAAVDLILNPSASHFAFGKQDVRRRLVLESSRAFGLTYVYANLLGNEAGRVIYDGATLIASGGQMLAEGRRLSFADREVLLASIDVDAARMGRTQLASYQPEPGGHFDACLEKPFAWPAAEPQASEYGLDKWETSDRIKEEELARAVALGLFDYLRKSRAGGFVVSLSGGADSAAVVVMVWLTVQFAIQQIGREQFVSKLSQIEGLSLTNDRRQIVKSILTTVYQATSNSSVTTESTAAELADCLSADHVRLDVEPMVRNYLDAVAGYVGRELNWEQDDIALQNIQARSRAPGAWLLANLRNALLLATSNRSEAAVGYATMDGDTCGGLAPIAGVDKAFLLKWLNWMHVSGPHGVGPIPALAGVVQQKPTAELRPQQAGQTDEDDLMPYDVLDWIEKAAIRDKLCAADILRRMRADYPALTDARRAEWIEKFFRLWARNQWKRERYAPSFHLDDENLDPKTWCRFPILSGGFAAEISDMRALVHKND